MSEFGNVTARRNRAAEPAEQRRSADQQAKRCIKCGDPSETQRCARCAKPIEANTRRYRGQGRPGPKPKVASDTVDLRHAMESLGRGYAGFAELARQGPLPAKRRLEALAEPLAHLGLAERLLRGVRRRNREAELAASKPRVAMRPPQLAFAFFASGAMGAR